MSSSCYRSHGSGLQRTGPGGSLSTPHTCDICGEIGLASSHQREYPPCTPPPSMSSEVKRGARRNRRDMQELVRIASDIPTSKPEKNV